MSGGPIEHLVSGFALMPFVGTKAHYWIEDKQTLPPTIGGAGRVRYYTSRCNLTAVTNNRVMALDPGDWPKCKRCELAKKAG